MDTQDETIFWEAWEIVTQPDGTRDIVDECGHLHDDLDECRDHHRLHANYTHFVEINYDSGEIIREVRHKVKRPKSGWNRLVYDMVNA